MHIEQIYVLETIDGRYTATLKAIAEAREYTTDIRRAVLMDFATANQHRREGEAITRLDCAFERPPRVAYAACCREHSNR